MELETTAVRGPCTFHTNGNMTINGVVYPPGDPSTAPGMVAAQAFQDAFDSCVSEIDSDDASGDRFSAVVRRLSTHINPYNPIIAFLIRSNMDLKVLLRDSDAKGILFYILNYATKTEQTLDVLLPLLLPVVERIRDESEGETSKEIAVRLVRSCLCKQLTSLNIGGPAAASKVFNLPDAKLSHKTVNCAMGPLLAWASSRDNPGADADETNRDDGEKGGDSSDDDNSDPERGQFVSAVGGKLALNQRAHLLYRHRCRPDGTNHPLHNMCFFVWTRCVRVVKKYTSRNAKARAKPAGSADRDSDREGGSDDDSDDDSDGEPCEDDVDNSGPTPPRRGRKPSDRYDCVGPYRKKWVQVRRSYSVIYCSVPS